jgi:hypothetical protein
MGSLRSFSPVKLFAGILVSDAKYVTEVETRLTAEFGAIDHRSPVIPFDFTDYYEKDMGDVLDRMFFSFEELIDAAKLPEIKRRTNQFEADIAISAGLKRPVNIDLGYLEQAKVLLASTKNFYHRIYLGGGIFGEVTMHFKNNTFQFFPWTYPDYQSRDYQDFFLKLRQIYRSQLRRMCITKQEEQE